MKLLRSNRPVKLLKLTRPLLMSFLLFNSSSAVMATEQPVSAAETAKATGKKTKPAVDKNAARPITLKTMEVTEKSDPQLAAASAEVALTPGGVTLINIDELRDRNVSSIADFFRYAPGVWAPSQSGNDEVFISSRGSNLDSNNYAGSGIKLLQDGLPVTAADGNNHNRMIDPLASSFATVARGANAFKYGASTLGGAVNFTSPTAHDSPEMRLSLSGGSFGQFLGRGTVSKVFNDSFDGLLTVEGKEWDGYRDHNKQDRFGLYSNFGWQISDAVVNRTFVSYIKNNQQLPGQLNRAQFAADPYQASTQAIDGNYQLNTETERVANKTTWTIDDKSSLDIGFSFENQQLYHPIVSKVMLPNVKGGQNDMFSMLVDTNQQDWGTSARYNLRLDSHELLLGLNFGTNSDKGGNYTNNGGQRGAMTNDITKKADNIEIFAQDHWHLTDKWTLTPALQGVFAHREVNNKRLPIPQDGQPNFLFAPTPNFYPQGGNPSNDYAGINPSLGLMYNVTQSSSLYGNVSRLFAPPTNYNISDNITAGSGSTNLKAMEGTSIEIGTRGLQKIGNLNSVNWDLALYYSWLNNEILSTTPPGGSPIATNFNNTIHAGVEGLIGGSFALDRNGTHTIKPVLSYTVNHFNFDGDATYGDNSLPAAPDYFLKGEVMYNHANGYFIGPTFDVVGKRWGDYANTYAVDAYSLLGMRTGWSNSHYKVFVEGRNLLDTVYVANTNILNTATSADAMLNAGAPLAFYGGVEITY
ncbi:TonB-dependent receptor family protein [Methylobacter psychrophilus]|uniref:TonB-dependent receptor family protein n=1 Tax=Methylobacter psychrophilus TaxID=96941 RepID=UPI0021D50F89|nr:TonB-dependent receptor [Methylobacter psychrophilus]